MVNALSAFRGYVTSYAAGGVDVYATHAYISDPSDTQSHGDWYGLAASDAGSIAGVF